MKSLARRHAENHQRPDRGVTDGAQKVGNGDNERLLSREADAFMKTGNAKLTLDDVWPWLHDTKCSTDRGDW